MADKIHLPTIDFNKINTFANERDLILWKQEANSKYLGRRIDESVKRNEQYVRNIKRFEELINNVVTVQMPTTKARIARMSDSISTASEAIDHLNDRKLDVKDEIIRTKVKYDKMIDLYLHAYKTETENLQNHNATYKEFDDVLLQMEKAKLEEKILRQEMIEQKKRNGIKAEIDNQIFRATIIDFVTAVKAQQEMEDINKELAEKRIIAQDLFKSYERERLNAGPINLDPIWDDKQIDRISGHIQSDNLVKGGELPMPTLDLKKSVNFSPFNISAALCPIILPSTFEAAMKTRKSAIKAGSDPIATSILNKLEQRSCERRTYGQENDSPAYVPFRLRTQAVKKAEDNATKVTNTGNKDEEINSVQNNQGKSNMKTYPKVQVLQNLILGPRQDGPERIILPKRPMREPDFQVTGKKTKKVSFGECPSQEDKANDDKLDKGEISAFFTQINNLFQPKEHKSMYYPEENHASTTGFRLESGASDFITKESMYSKDVSAEDTLFSLSKSTENIEQDQANSFLWSNSQQSTGVAGGLNLF